MLQLTAQMRIFVAAEAVDFRKGIDGLAALCRRELNSDPMSGGIFVFRNRRGTSVKILTYDGRGFWLCQKRLSAGRFRFWPSGTGESVLEAHQLQVLLSGGDPEAARGAPVWRRIGFG